MNIQEIVKPRIEALGYKIEQFDELHYEAYTYLTDANIDIPDNLFNPEVDSTILGVYAGFAAGKNPEFIPVLPYLQPRMKLRHLKLIQEALEAKNDELLATYVDIFSIPNINSNRSDDIANLAKMDAPYEHLKNQAYSDEEVRNERRITFLNKFGTMPIVTTDTSTGKYYGQK